MGVLGKELENFVDLVLETTAQHFIGLVKTEKLDVVGPECPTVDHIVHPSWSTDNNVNALLELSHVLADVRTADASVAFDVHVVAERNDDFLDLLRQLTGGRKDEGLGTLDGLVDFLEDGDGESSGLPGTGLGLGDDIVPFDDGDDGALLDSGRTLETFRMRVRVNFFFEGRGMP